MKRTIPFLAIILTGMILIASSDKPVTIHMVGDSTMADREDTTITPERGWGQLFPTFLSENVIVRNYAKNGRSTRSFIEEGRWDEALANVQRGDFVLIQFGHNDTKKTDATRYTTIEQYQANLTKMIDDVKKKKATPILLTPIARRYFSKETGELVNRHGGYVNAARRVAKAEKITLIDLNTLTSQWLTREGDSASVKYFCHIPKGIYAKYPDGKIDNTHLSLQGALQVAKMAAQDIQRQRIKNLSNNIILTRNEAIYTQPVRKIEDKDSQVPTE